MIGSVVLFLGAYLAAVEAGTFEIIVKKYEALSYREIANIENSFYNFSFCLCQKESKLPNNDGNCKCQMNISGKTAKESAPKAIYSASCLYNPKSDKCLVGRIQSESGKYIYVNVKIGNRQLTDPEWQSLSPTKKKKTAHLAAKVKKRLIKLEYLTFDLDSENHSKILPSSIKPSPEPRKNPKSRRLEVTKVSKITTTTFSPPTTTSKILPSKSLMMPGGDPQGRFIQSLEDARKFLQKLGKIQKISPLSFNIPEFKKAMIIMHNRLRYIHGAQLVVNDPKAEVAAQSWANKLGKRESCLVHEHRKGFGENLFYFAADYLTDPYSMAEAVVRTFYSEGKGYDYRRFRRYHFAVGHFTQMIWDSSTKIGVGVSIKRFSGRRRNGCQPRKSTYMLYVVVKYSPAGNVQSSKYYFENVKPVMRKL